MWFDTLATFIANRLDNFVIFFAFILIIFLYKRESRQEYLYWPEMKHRLKGVLLISTAGGLSWLIATIVKYIVRAPRPYLSLENVNLLFPYGGFESFPSGHSAVFAGLAMAMYFYNKKLGYLFGFFALCIGIFRIIAGVHFPIDILTGYIFGIVVSWGVYRFYHYIDDRAKIEPWLKHLP
jgi:membrane-associated phospholipid phosphatase